MKTGEELGTTPEMQPVMLTVGDNALPMGIFFELLLALR